MLRGYLRPVVGALRSVCGTNGLATRLTMIERNLDFLSRIVEPAQLSYGVEPSPEAHPTPSFDVNVMLHQARSALLREMPPGANRLLSAGCAGKWYFDWIEQCYGHVPDHLGIEYYSPRPPDLPANVSWITNTASDMHGVDSATCDLVFSGQNIEHLWPDEVSGFLLEAARVLKPGGHLVVDSPNRLLTAQLNWSHPEHTIELTVPEIRRLLALSGFDVTKQAGVWLCCDPKTSQLFPFDPNITVAGWSVAERLIAAAGHPDQSFSWWLEGRRNRASPDRAAIDALLGGAFRVAWPERTQRCQVPPGRQIEARPDGDWVRMPRGEAGMMFFGPYMPLRAGSHRVTFDIVSDINQEGVVAVCDVCVGSEGRVLQRREVTADMQEVTLAIELASQEFGVQFRCLSTAGGFRVRRNVRLEESIA